MPQHFKGQGVERVTSEDGDGVVPFLMDGWSAAPFGAVFDGRMVVVHQSGVVAEFDGHGCQNGIGQAFIFFEARQHLVDGDQQERTPAFSSWNNGKTHRLFELGGSGAFKAQILLQTLLDQIQPGLKVLL